jgi:hypothetical protein
VTDGGDSGTRIFVLYWRCPLIRVSVIRGSTVIVILQVHPVSEYCDSVGPLLLRTWKVANSNLNSETDIVINLSWFSLLNLGKFKVIR